jgi:hypothetical protein
MEILMARAEKSLRVMIERWLAPEIADDVRITRYKDTSPRLERYVCVETFNAAGHAAMFFLSPRWHMANFPTKSGKASNARRIYPKPAF